MGKKKTKTRTETLLVLAQKAKINNNCFVGACLNLTYLYYFKANFIGF